MLQRLLERMGFIEPIGPPRVEHRRSPHWPRVRELHLMDHPTCAACGRRKRLEVHHVRPFHLFPTLELEPSNLLTLCEDEVVNCHLLWGHFQRWDWYNCNVREDVTAWRAKVDKFREEQQREGELQQPQPPKS